jgi:translation initiation factor IF-3
MNFRGREAAYSERSKVLMDRIIQDMTDVAKVEKEPKQEGRRITMMLAPAKS